MQNPFPFSEGTEKNYIKILYLPMKIAILAGGKGTRLFPLSRESYPKQFLKLFGNKSLFQETFLRFFPEFSPEDIFILTNERYKFLVKEQLDELGVQIPQKNLLFEPISRNTAPAIALLSKFLTEILDNPEESLLIVPSDHFIAPKEKFLELVKKSEEAIHRGFIVTFGINPSYPSTGYGYIEVGEPVLTDTYKVVKFHEKPSLERAMEYLKTGRYFWNSGIFGFTPETIYGEFKNCHPQIYAFIEKYSFEEFVEHYGELPDISIDYAVMEKTKRAVVIPANLTWSDIGSWDAVYDLLEKDGRGNAVRGKVIAIDTQNSLVWSNKGLIATLGVENLIVVETEDAILITKKEKAQEIRKLAEFIKEKYPNLLKEGKTVYRPWGFYTVLEWNSNYKIKKLVVKPGRALSMQMHYHRSEHWIVVKGTAKVLLEDEKGSIKEYFVHENESIFVPKTRKHRIENPGKVDLEIIEVQVGEYLEEDDIVRFYDDFQRV